MSSSSSYLVYSVCDFIKYEMGQAKAAQIPVFIWAAVILQGVFDGENRVYRQARGTSYCT